MSDTNPNQQDAMEKSWRLLNLQADKMLKLAQAQIEPWKMMVGGLAAGGAIVGILVALFHFLG